MKTIDDVIVRIIEECKMAPILSLIIIGGGSLFILLVNLLFLIPLSRKMTETAGLFFQFDVEKCHKENACT